jgi:hypothetical protein
MRNAGTEYFTAFDRRLSTIAATSTRSPWAAGTSEAAPKRISIPFWAAARG